MQNLELRAALNGAALPINVPFVVYCIFTGMLTLLRLRNRRPTSLNIGKPLLVWVPAHLVGIFYLTSTIITKPRFVSGSSNNDRLPAATDRSNWVACRNRPRQVLRKQRVVCCCLRLQSALASAILPSPPVAGFRSTTASFGPIRR